jgi:subtilisin family serine protease
VLAVLTIALLTAITVVSPTSAQAAPGPSDAPEWWFDAWSAPALWAAGADGRGITVAVIDTGVQASIPELSGKVLPGADFIGNGTDGRTDFDSEDFSHGTAMASLIVASQGYGDIEGLAPAAKILPIAVPLRGVVRYGTPTANATSEAVKYAADHGAKIISMSLGGFVYEGQDPAPCPSKLQDAVLYALQKGAIVVAASGNSGADGSPVEEPGVCLGVISVGAVDARSKVTSFSSRHPYLTVSAPGDEIPTLSKQASQAFVGGGTSQATAITSAALALVWSKFPTSTNQQIVSRLLGSVSDLGPKGNDDQYGLGLINPYAAVKASAAASKPNEVFTGAKPLLDLRAAKISRPVTKPAAGRADAPIGAYTVGSPAALLGATFYLLLGLAVLFLALGITLFILAFRRRPRQVPAAVATAQPW